MSGNGSPTECISEFTDSHLNPLVSHIPSYIQDTTDLLCKPEGTKHQTPNYALPVTPDTSPLHTNIPHGEGTNACANALRSNNQTKPSVRHLTDPIRHTLTKNNFTLLDRNPLQVQGTAMGTKMAHHTPICLCPTLKTDCHLLPPNVLQYGGDSLTIHSAFGAVAKIDQMNSTTTPINFMLPSSSPPTTLPTA